jgi:translation elongation factor EF-Tu-like GTPase
MLLPWPGSKQVNDKGILVRANIRLLSTAKRGRTASIRGSYRPNHNFFDSDDRNMTVGFVDLPNGTELHPGESLDLSITFWSWPDIEGQIYPGREWRIQEGAKLVGIGTVLAVLPTDP